MSSGTASELTTAGGATALAAEDRVLPLSFCAGVEATLSRLATPGLGGPASASFSRQQPGRWSWWPCATPGGAGERSDQALTGKEPGR